MSNTEIRALSRQGRSIAEIALATGKTGPEARKAAEHALAHAALVATGPALYGKRWMSPLARDMRWHGAARLSSRYGMMSNWSLGKHATPGWVAHACLELVRERLESMETGHPERANLIRLADSIENGTLTTR